jgi:hypothetical protein
VLRTIGGLLIGLALFIVYAMAAIVLTLLIFWQQITGTEPEVELTGTELDPY